MSQRIDLELTIPPHLVDHRYMGVPVLPAVEALQALARTVTAAGRHEGLDVTRSSDARFMRFLMLDPDADSAPAVAELEEEEDGVRATLLTVKTAGKSGIKRNVEHVSAIFGQAGAEQRRGGTGARPQCQLAFSFEAERLYAELVPFGPSFHNVAGEITLHDNLAVGLVRCPGLPGGDGPLGSPFPFDAALHLACAWAQRHLGAVLFPTGYAGRRILLPTEPAGEYRASVVPLPGATPQAARFDITLRDGDGQVREELQGVLMEDVSRGKLAPPDWVKA